MKLSPDIEAVADREKVEVSAKRIRKVSMSEFADLAGVSKSQVHYYFKAWELAAEAGYCQHADQLSPGEEDASLDDIGPDDEELRELWLKFYREARDAGEARAPNKHGTKPGSASTPKKGTTADAKMSQAVRALTTTAEQLSKNLLKVINGVGVKLVGDDADLTKFADDLRKTRFVLDRQCREIDQLIERIGFGDADDQ